MRIPLKNQQSLQLHNAGMETPARELVIENLIGMGANVIAYEATDKTGQIHYVLKECYPDTGASRLTDGAISWKSPEIETGARARMQRAYEMQIALQNEAATENTNTHLVDTIYEANNTLYTITDHRNATTYNKVEDKNLQETFITARSIARAVKAYHDNGYLHLDIKPNNVMVMPETRDIVLLLDFDSITRVNELANAPLSYSPNYAAPEQIQGRVDKICAATDIYAIGAIVFRRIMGRLPSLEDQSVFSDWDYSDNPLFEKLSMKARRLTTEFFRKTLSATVKKRYQNMDECIVALDALVAESDPNKRFIIDARPDCSNTFVGRTAELEVLHRKLCGEKPVFITGMKGIGKTELVKNYARILGSEYDVIRFAEYNGSLGDLISSGELVSIANKADDTITIDSFAGIVDERTLLIIDNYRTAEGNPMDGKLFDKLAALKSKLLITTYENAQDIYETAEWIELEELSQAEQYGLFEKEYGETLSEPEAEIATQILKEIHGFTLLIPLIAKLLKNSSHGFAEVLQKLSDTGTTGVTGKVRHKKDSTIYRANIGDIVRAVFDMSNLTNDEHYVMNCLAMLKGIRIRRSTLVGWIGEMYDDVISDLAFNHWINADGIGSTALISMHDIIRDIVMQGNTSFDTPWIQKPIDEYLQERSGFLTQEEDLPHSYPHWLSGTGLGYVQQFSGMTGIRVRKKKELINTLLHTIDIEQKPETLIEILCKIIRWDLSRAFNYAPDCEDLLIAIETSESFSSLSYSNKHALLALHLFYFVKALCDIDRPRTEEEVHSITLDIIRISKTIISMAKKYKIRKTQYNIIRTIYDNALLTAGVTLGSFLFTTNYPDYSSAALNEYTEFVNGIAKDLKGNYSEYIWAQPDHNYFPFELNINHFNECMEPGSFSKVWEEYFDEEEHIAEADDRDFEAYLRYEAESSGDLEALHQYELQQQHQKLQNDAEELVTQCVQLGYVAADKPEKWSEINIEHLSDPDNLKEAARLLALAKEKYELAFDPKDDLFDNMAMRGWLSSACIHACCSGDFKAAKEFYDEYLIAGFSLRGWFNDEEIYTTLNYLGFSDFCLELLNTNIKRLEEIFTAPEIEDPADLIPWPEDTPEIEKIEYERSRQRNIKEERWLVATKIMKYAEILGDTDLIKKYSLFKEQLEDPGFELEP